MERVGPYEVHEQLGRGGMGTVFRAADPRTGQEVALKLLAVADERARRRLVLEARALARLRHRNVVSLLDAGEERGRPWIALELVRGRSLQERLDREGALAPREAAALVAALAAGLTHAHRAGVLHRDLKPANVLLPDGAGAPKLTDFGLAGFTFDLSQSRLTRSGTLMGSPGYWAPEQASGQASALGPHTDVYGLGAVLYACLTGRPPLEGESLPEILVATESRRPEPPRTDRALDAIALRCLEKRPADRYPTVDAVARELARFLSGRATRPRRRRLVAAAALAALAAAAAAAWALTAPPEQKPPAAPPVAPSPTEPTEARPPSPDPRTEVAALITSARARFRSSDFRGALADCDRALGLDASNGSAYVLRGAVRGNLGDNAGVIADCDRAIELDPRDASAYALRAAARTNLGGDPEGVLADCDRAIELDPGLVSGYANRASARLNLRDRQGALADFDRALELDPSIVGLRAARADLKEDLEDHEGALVDYDRALELDPRQPAVHARRATARLNLGDLEGAIADYDRAIELGAGDAIVHANRGLARMNLGDHQGAVTDFDRALELDPSGAAPVHLNRGMARQALGDDPGAIADWETALRLQPGASWAADARGLITEAQARLAGQ